MKCSRVSLVACVLALLGGSYLSLVGQTATNSAPWRTARVNFVASQRPVRDLLKEFAASQSMPLSVSEPVKGVVSGNFKGVETEKFLNAICESNDLVWFYDGVRINIESTDEVLSRPLSVPNLTVQTLRDVLFSVGYASGPPGREVEARSGHRPGLILLVGGPQFVQATEVLARDLDAQEALRSTEEIAVRTFRLNYASASDTRVDTGSTNTVVPGVATALQNLMANQAAGSNMSTGSEETLQPRSRPGLRGTGLASVGNQQRPNPMVAGRPDAQDPASGERPQAVQPTDPRAPMIVVDSRLNAILVRDVVARMPLYEELIKMLDVPTKAIEITAAIVDIDSNNGRNIGLELLGLRNNGKEIFRGGFDADRGVFDGTDTDGEIGSFVEGANLARGAGFNATALIGGMGYELLGRLRAIEQAGAGQIISSPSVLTMENVQAVIRTDEKVYVRVEGNMEVDLFDVTTGVQLQVTPSVLNEGGRQDYRLQIAIKDGSFVDQTVDQIPITRESAITTQAIVPENKTLLLGGYFVERRTRSNVGVPLLSKIPVLGKVLSRNEKGHNRSQRFFFITPRLVDINQEATTPLNFRDAQANQLALPSRLRKTETSREQTEDLARRMATGAMDVEPILKENPLLPALPKPAATTKPKNPVFFGRKP